MMLWGWESGKGRGWAGRGGVAYPVAVTLRAVILRLGVLFRKLLLPLRASSKENVIDEGILQQGQKHKDKAAHEVHVNGFDVGDFGQRLPKVRVDGCHGQHGGDPCKTDGSMRGFGPLLSSSLLTLLLYFLKQFEGAGNKPLHTVG